MGNQILLASKFLWFGWLFANETHRCRLRQIENTNGFFSLAERLAALLIVLLFCCRRLQRIDKSLHLTGLTSGVVRQRYLRPSVSCRGRLITGCLGVFS